MKNRLFSLFASLIMVISLAGVVPTMSVGAINIDSSMLLNYYWVNNIQCPHVYEFLNGGRLNEYYIDANKEVIKSNLHFSRQGTYKINDNDITITLGGYSCNLSYVKKSQISIRNQYVGVRNQLAEVSDNEYLFYETTWAPQAPYVNSPMYLRKSAVKKPADVSGFKAVATSTSAVKLTWNKTARASKYAVFQMKGGKWTTINTLSGTSCLVSNLKPGTTYKFAVKAYANVDGKVVSSASFPTVTTSTKPATVNYRIATANRKVALRWNKVTGATGYIVYYKTAANGKWQRLKVTTGTGYTKTGLIKGKTYWFTVRAYRTVNGKNYFGAFTTKTVKVK